MADTGGGIKNILILDDNADFRNLLKAKLVKYFPGTKFHEYDPVVQGVPPDNFNWRPYDVLILDYYLCVHKVTGLDLLDKHGKQPGFPTTVMLTGAGVEETETLARKSGIQVYMRKDKLDFAVLAAAIMKAHQKNVPAHSGTRPVAGKSPAPAPAVKTKPAKKTPARPEQPHAGLPAQGKPVIENAPVIESIMDISLELDDEEMEPGKG
jgi:CheY-like chemotaxis protein